jgi:UDP-N-acetylmuramoyl-tripeptide--D-alanyl-D-alanine ligase
MLLSLEKHHEWAVLELGMNHYHEIETLSYLTQHEIAVITNIGTAHIEFFGSKENILKAKLEITSTLTKDQVLVLNGRDPLLNTVDSDTFKIERVGNEFEDSIYAKNIQISADATTFDLVLDKDEYCVSIPLIGEHHVLNALLAIKVGILLDIDIKLLIQRLKGVSVPKMRFETVAKEDVIFINDAYNASFDSILASVSTFTKMPLGNRIVVLGDVFECGEFSQQIHAEIGSALNAYTLDKVYFVGLAMKHAFDTYMGNKIYFENKQRCIESLNQDLIKGDYVLLKGSRGMGLETIINEYRRA